MTFDDVIALHPWMAAFLADLRETCHDCGAALGEVHADGCDTARCAICHGQRISCGCPWEQTGGDRWWGLMYLEEYRLCLEQNYWCRDFFEDGGRWVPVATPEGYRRLLDISLQNRGRVRWHVPCQRNDLGAHTDLNRAAPLVRGGRAERN